MNTFILVILTIIVIGAVSCSDSEMTKAKAKFACSQHGEIHSLRGFVGAVCNDGTTISNRIIEDTIITDPAYFPTNKE